MTLAVGSELGEEALLAGLVSMTRLSHREGKLLSMILNGIGTLVVLFVLTINPFRGYPLLSLAASLLIALGLYRLWVKSKTPRTKAAATAG